MILSTVFVGGFFAISKLGQEPQKNLKYDGGVINLYDQNGQTAQGTDYAIPVVAACFLLFLSVTFTLMTEYFDARVFGTIEQAR